MSNGTPSIRMMKTAKAALLSKMKLMYQATPIPRKRKRTTTKKNQIF
jgi:hypothetical protein